MRAHRLLTPLFLWAAPALAQSPAKLPVLTPRITELGSYVDTTRGMTGAVEYATLSPRGNLVAFNSHGSGLWIWNPATKTSRQLISGPGTESMAWSPQGDALVLSRADEQSSKWYVWTVRVNPESGALAAPPQRVSLSPTTTYTPQFSPDGTWIAYSREEQPGPGRPSSLVLVPTAGGPEKVLAAGSRVRRIRWDADGQGISFVSYADSTWTTPRVMHVSLKGGGAPALVFDNTGVDFAPDIKTDGRQVQRAKGTRDLDAWTLADRTGKAIRELQYPAPIVITETSGAWQMAGFREVTPRAIQITSLADGSTRELVPASLEAGAPTWFRDGSRLAVMVRDQGVFSLVTVRPDGSERRSYPLKANPYHEIFLFGWNNADLRISPDGRYASYIGGDRESVELVELSSGATRTLAKPPTSVSTVVWRKDSRGLRYLRGGGGSAQGNRAVMEVSVDGAEKLVRALPASEFPVPAVPLIDENTILIFGAGSTNYRMMTLDGTPPRILMSTPGWGGAISPDRSTLIVRPGQPHWRTPVSLHKVSVISLATGAQRELRFPFDEQQDAGMQWHPDGKSLYVGGTESPDGPVIIYQVPLDGSAPKPVARANTTQRVLFAASPDQKYIAYTVGKPMEFQFVSVDFSAAIASLSTP